MRLCARIRQKCKARLRLEALERRSVPAILTEGHIDIGVGYDGVAWDLHVHDETNNNEYDPGDVLLYLGRNARATQPSDPAYNFIGAGWGNPIWVLPQVPSPKKLLLGIGAEEIAPGTFASYFETDRRVQSEGEWIRFDLIDVAGPAGGETAVWQTDSFGKVINWMSTHTNRPADATFTLAGEHGDYNWAFTLEGIYEVSFQASAYLGPGMTNKTESDVVTYFFGVEDTGGFTPAPNAPNRSHDSVNLSPTMLIGGPVLRSTAEQCPGSVVMNSVRPLEDTDRSQFSLPTTWSHLSEADPSRSDVLTWLSVDELSAPLDIAASDRFDF